MASLSARLILLVAVGLWNSLSSEGKLCNASTGEWVLLNSKPLYTESNCRFWQDYSKCQSKGRTDLNYQKYEWQTSGCLLDPFSAAKLAQALKSKVVLIVGDSVTSDFSQSFLCMANSGSAKLADWTGKIAGVPLTGLKYPGARSYHILRTFSRFLVQRLPSDPGSKVNKVDLGKVDPIWEPMAKAADVIVLQSALWWFTGLKEWYLNGRKLRSLTDYQAYAMGMQTINTYLQSINFKGTVILLSASPMHYNLPAGIANKGSACETSKLLTYRQVTKWTDGQGSLNLLRFQRNITRGTLLKLIDITTMSLLRPDSHMQNWHYQGGKLPAGSKDDCTHWCGAGALDMWVKVLYNYLIGRMAV